jgi:hypothetical protein
MKIRIAAASTIIALAAAAAAAQPFQSWKEVNDWNIVFNEATEGCFMEHVTPEGFVLHIGTTAALFGRGSDDRQYFVGFYAPTDSGFASSQEDGVTFVSGPDAFTGTAHEITKDGYHGWWTETNNDNLVDDLRDRRQMTVTSSSGGEAIINLIELGIDEAFAEMQECQLRKG